MKPHACACCLWFPGTVVRRSFAGAVCRLLRRFGLFAFSPSLCVVRANQSPVVAMEEYDYEDDVMGDEYEYGSDEEEIGWNQQHAWKVIDAYFREKGLVRQQLDSFDYFINTRYATIVVAV